MVSDDTEHAIMVAESLLDAAADAERFAAALAWRMRFWLLGFPAGAGSATLRAILKLWLGCPPARSGIPSAGNGPAMRAPLLGVALAVGVGQGPGLHLGLELVEQVELHRPPPLRPGRQPGNRAV